MRLSPSRSTRVHFAGEAPTPLDVNVIALDQAGQQVGSAKQTSTLAARSSGTAVTGPVDVQSHIDLDPGDYEVRVAVTDRKTGATGSVFSQIAIPDFSTDRLSVSDIAVELGPGQQWGSRRFPCPSCRRHGVHSLAAIRCGRFCRCTKGRGGPTPSFPCRSACESWTRAAEQRAISHWCSARKSSALAGRTAVSTCQLMDFRPESTCWRLARPPGARRRARKLRFAVR